MKEQPFLRNTQAVWYEHQNKGEEYNPRFNTTHCVTSKLKKRNLTTYDAILKGFKSTIAH